MSRKFYPTDVSDEEWEFVAPCLTLLREDAAQCVHPFTGQQHVGISRRGRRWGPLDDILHEAGHDRRNIVLIVNGYSAALIAVASSDLVGTVARHFADHLARSLGLVVFALPMRSAPLKVSQTWHPRLDADPVHQWLRQCVKETCVLPARKSGNHRWLALANERSEDE